jgi:Immunity protein 26
MTKLTYKEGDIFWVPLNSGGFAVGVVARVGNGGRIVLGYFFSQQFGALPDAPELSELRSEDAILAVRFGDLHLMSGRWPIVSEVRPWDPKMWPMPKFVRIEPPTNNVYLVTYSESDPGPTITDQRINDNSAGYEIDCLIGATAVEIILSHRLENAGSNHR